MFFGNSLRRRGQGVVEPAKSVNMAAGVRMSLFTTRHLLLVSLDAGRQMDDAYSKLHSRAL